MQQTFDFGDQPLTAAQKGDLGEVDFNRWLRRNRVGYVYVDQSPQTFSRLFPGPIKRPDFMISPEPFGPLAIDVKNCGRLNSGSFTFWFGSHLERAENFERLFRMPLWYAYRERQANGCVVWYWVSAHDVTALSRTADRSKPYFEIAPRHFARVETAVDLYKLSAQMRSCR